MFRCLTGILFFLALALCSKSSFALDSFTLLSKESHQVLLVGYEEFQSQSLEDFNSKVFEINKKGLNFSNSFATRIYYYRDETHKLRLLVQEPNLSERIMPFRNRPERKPPFPLELYLYSPLRGGNHGGYILEEGSMIFMHDMISQFDQMAQVLKSTWSHGGNGPRQRTDKYKKLLKNYGRHNLEKSQQSINTTRDNYFNHLEFMEDSVQRSTTGVNPDDKVAMLRKIEEFNAAREKIVEFLQGPDRSSPLITEIWNRSQDARDETFFDEVKDMMLEPIQQFYQLEILTDILRDRNQGKRFTVIIARGVHTDTIKNLLQSDFDYQLLDEIPTLNERDTEVLAQHRAEVIAKSVQAVEAVYAQEVCYSCKNPGNLNKCSGCQDALYCTRECQKKDWPIHKEYCREKQSQNSQEKEKEKEREDVKPGEKKKRKIIHNCSSCEKPGAIHNCSQCQVAYYCDRACQKTHWPKHKTNCRNK